MKETFYGYCFPIPGEWHTPEATLQDTEEVYRYTQLHGKTGMFREVRVTDSEDFMVVQMIDGQYVFPEEWKKFNGEVKPDETAEESNEKTEDRNSPAEVKA
ncbi:hypothetical protein [Paenibacillus dokdonensis]|uniref:hypothetical protein n=1 Tax=Paenibacillus dokdonensis TaxID=2567944 RepID=UPI0010A944F4|nr:hypothetical protein [Paenibacillus dokdonensis]